MSHLSEEQLILHYYGESDGSEHLNACDACRRNLESLRVLLDACKSYPVPERPPEFEQDIWNAVWRAHSCVPRRDSSRRVWWAGWRIPVIAAAMAAMLVAAFLAGRFSHRPAPAIAGLSIQNSERILEAALGDHLERSQIVLVELAHTASRGPADITEQQQRARDLLSENRLYRQTAALAGDNATAAVLDDLERALLAIIHSPSKISSPELQRIQQRIEDEGILFKIRVLDSNMHTTEKL